MNSTKHQEHSDASASASDSANWGTASPHGEILAAARRATSVHAFLAEALACIAHSFGSPFAALYVRGGSEVIEEETHSGSTDPGFWRPAVQQYLTDSLADKAARAQVLSASDAGLKITLLSAPLFNTALGISGAVVVVVRGGSDEARTHLQALEALVELTASAIEMARAPAAETASAAAAPNQALARAALVSSPEELAFAITNNLRAKLGCELIALGLVAARKIRILSIAGQDEVKPRNPGVAQLRAAMEECLDLGKPIVCQQDGAWEQEALTSGFRLHQQWQHLAGGASVVSIPLNAGERCVAVLSMRRRAEEPFKSEQLEEVRALVEPFAPALLLVRDASRTLPRHIADTARGSVAALVQPGHRGRKLLCALAAAAALWFCVGTLDYRLTVAATLTPAQQRHVAAPFDGTLLTSSVLAGDVVHAGDVLCEFDRRELELERDRLRSQLAVLEREHMRALATEQPVEAQLVGANQRLTRVQLAITEQRIEQAVLRAPFDGVVISGDLRKQIGAVMRQGEPLFEIAPLDNWTLEMDIPESVAGDLIAGLEGDGGGRSFAGRFAGSARPEAPQPFELTRVRPRAEVKDGRNVFIAEADMVPEVDWMRPGMEGIAKVDLGPRPVWWVALHGILDRLRMSYWL